MNCSEVCRLLAEGRAPGKDARSHIGQCSTCGVLAAGLPKSNERPDATSVDRYKGIVSTRLTRVRPVASDRQLTFIFVALFLCFSISAAVPVGFYGLRALSAGQMALYFAVILISALFAVSAVVQEMIPGSRRYLSPRITLIVELAVLAGTVLLLFHSFRTTHFVHTGRGCLQLGTECAAGSAILFALVLKHGWFTAPVRAGTVVGFLSGLTGVAVLAMHCPLLTTPHIMVWHLGVLPLGMLVGASIGFAIQKFRPLRNF